MNCILCDRDLILDQNSSTDEIWRCPFVYSYDYNYNHFVTMPNKKFIVTRDKLYFLYLNTTETLSIITLKNLNTILEIKTDINTAYDICKIKDSLLLDKIKLYQTFS